MFHKNGVLRKYKNNFLVNTSGGYFLPMSPNLKRRRTEHTQFKYESKTSKTTTRNDFNYSYSTKKNLSKEEKM